GTLSRLSLAGTLSRLSLAGTLSRLGLGSALSRLLGAAVGGFGLGQVTATRVCLAAVGVTGAGATGITETLANLCIAIGDVAAMPGIVAPGIVGDFGAIELVEAIDVDIDAIAPPVEVAPNRRSNGGGGCKGQYTTAGKADRIPIVGLVLVVRPGAVDDPG